MRDIGALPGYTGSVAVGINNSGQIVGIATALAAAPRSFTNLGTSSSRSICARLAIT
jgi:uncharacterized membrane protein